jgi:hypothetical protein
MRPGAGPGPILGARNEAGADRIQRHSAGGGVKMGFVHRDRSELTLPEMTGQVIPRVDVRGVTAIEVGKGAPRPSASDCARMIWT